MRWLLSTLSVQRLLASANGSRFRSTTISPLSWSKPRNELHNSKRFISSQETENPMPKSSDEHSQSTWSNAEKPMMMEVEIISKENIKPTFSTPHHLRKYKLSSIDQVFFSEGYPFVFFYPNNLNTSSTIGVISERLERLKQSLSKTLTRFYPFAGKIKDNFSIDCNDEGVYFVEARVNCELTDFLSQPDIQAQRLFCDVFDTPESKSAISLLMVQVNIFACGGIAVGTCISHKLADGYTIFTLLKAWAAETRGSSEVIHPSFIAPSLFLQNDSLSYAYTPNITLGKFRTRRFVFDALALETLKTKIVASSYVPDPTRVESVSALIWKCATNASKKTFDFQNKTSFLSIMVNLRNKISPPLPEHSIGNIFWFGTTLCSMNDELEYPSMVGNVRDAIKQINNDFITEIKDEKGYLKLGEVFKSFDKLLRTNNRFDSFSVTSLCNYGYYEIDFGWGKPMWICFCNPGIPNLIFLTDTRVGGGIEAWVTLSKEEMAIFECDPELLAFASVDPSPLELCKPTSHV